MEKVSRSLCLGIGLLACFACGARAATLTYAESVNSGNVQTLDFSVPSITNTSFTNPYASHVVTPVGSNGWLITYTLSSEFVAQASNAKGGLTQNTSGALTFTLTFDVPVQLSASISEGGGYSLGAGGTVSVFTGAQVTTQDAGPVETFGHSDSLSPSGGTSWSDSNDLGESAGYFRTFKFAINNILTASALPGAALDTELIDKGRFAVAISANPLPLPSAAGAGLSAMLLAGAIRALRLARRRCA